jgi:hypothetical protein
VTGHRHAAYAAARDLTLAVDTFRVLSQAGMVTDTDILRVEAATRAYVGLPARRRRGPDQPVSVPERDLRLEGACGAEWWYVCGNGIAGCATHRWSR